MDLASDNKDWDIFKFYHIVIEKKSMALINHFE